MTNISGETQGFNMFYYKIFNSEGNSAESVAAYFDNSIEYIGDMRDEATNEGNFYLLYTGDGDYYIEFDNHSEEYELKLPIKK